MCKARVKRQKPQYTFENGALGVNFVGFSCPPSLSKGPLSQLPHPFLPRSPVSRGRDEVETAMHTGVRDHLLPINAHLLIQVPVELLVDMLQNGYPATQGTQKMTTFLDDTKEKSSSTPPLYGVLGNINYHSFYHGLVHAQKNLSVDQPLSSEPLIFALRRGQGNFTLQDTSSYRTPCIHATDAHLQTGGCSKGIFLQATLL